ncbi:protein C18orf25 homolog isoform X1 [Erpetoichthys calabaricus]|uniref:protein C18orf25 homolog isoform X1 n=1 Tax=Erpetoichthys calabaricus TaxID=27687 RepID=UPI0022347450|nr:protein C18orf25 homolog isoform X1 [Erpetoichthys calabaricus]
MKMADAVKTEDLVDSETPPEVAVDSGVERTGGTEVLKTETSSSEKGESPIQNDPGLLSSMPCLLMELKRDSPESQQASTESEKQISGKAYESDSSNPCMLSPSSSGHLADSDTLSSAEDEVSRIGTSSIAEGGDPNSEPGGITVSGARKSRRSRSESEMSSAVMAAKKNRWQVTGSEKQNGRLAKVKGQRSQKHKERIRLLRQKREAAARKKYNLLQDSSTSDSDLTCDSTTSSSDDDEEEASGSSKTITADIPDGPPVIAHYDISDTNSEPDIVNVENLLAAAVAQELKTNRTRELAGNSWESKGSLGSSLETGCLEGEFTTGDQSICGPLKIKEEINIASSDSEVEIVEVQENARCIHPRGGVIQSISSWKHTPVSQYNSTRQSHLWTAVSTQSNWASPPEVVDLTLDEDARRKYLL